MRYYITKLDVCGDRCKYYHDDDGGGHWEGWICCTYLTKFKEIGGGKVNGFPDWCPLKKIEEIS